MNKLLLLFSLILSTPVLPLRRFLEHGKLLGFHPPQRRINHRLQSEKELPPSISFKSVWTVSAETINFLHWWAFFIGTKFIWSGFHKDHSIITALLGIRDDLQAMKRGEVSLMVFADYSEAFDTVCFKTVLTKMHALGFSNEFLTWMVHYLFDRRQFVQIDDKTSSIETVLFGVPQGPILGLSIFNLYVSDLQKHIKCPCYQYGDDTTFFLHSKTKDLANGVVEINDAIWRLGDYSSKSNLALNEGNTKWMLVSTHQMSRAKTLHDYYQLWAVTGSC